MPGSDPARHQVMCLHTVTSYKNASMVVRLGAGKRPRVALDFIAYMKGMRALCVSDRCAGFMGMETLSFPRSYQRTCQRLPHRPVLDRKPCIDSPLTVLCLCLIIQLSFLFEETLFLGSHTSRGCQFCPNSSHFRNPNNAYSSTVLI